MKCQCSNGANSNFCSSCGSELIKHSPILLKEIEMLKMRIEQLTNIIEIKNHLTCDMNLMSKYTGEIDPKHCVFPIQACIMEISPSFQNLLGYSDLTNYYLPNLFARHTFKKVRVEQNMVYIKHEIIEGLVAPKFICEENLYLKHRTGTFINVLVKATLYLEAKNFTPTHYSLNVLKICEMGIKETSVPYRANPPYYLYQTSPQDSEFPEAVFKCNYRKINDPIDFLNNSQSLLPVANEDLGSGFNNLILPVNNTFQFDNTFVEFENIFNF
eukprot:TRINITY_DN7865_c0_g1_i2.p1 TRINITY_DN7865_c0_g1~~TRINITY_DN7865_c0_g1_i2.p1  ORF type:complete len:271 (-),score=57.07 TRINITY_DN7865_c0_g1_i2:31-843(-)